MLDGDEWVESDDILRSRGDVSRMKEAPEGFQKFAYSVVGKPDKDGCKADIVIFEMHSEGFVVGSSGWSNCQGGDRYIWSNQGGEWEVWFTTKSFDYPCDQLMDAGVPENSFSITCQHDGQSWNY